MREYKICKRCVMDTTVDRDIIFDQNGYCNYCTMALEALETIPAVGDKTKLEALFLKIKEECKNDSYDCLVGVSGGLDSSYVIYLGYQYGLRMLGVHVDDGLDTELAVKNMHDLCEKAGVKLLNIRPDPEQYRDLTLSFFKASVPNLAIPQDNVIFATVTDITKQYHLKYIFSGKNISMESILQRGNEYTPADTVHIRAIQKEFSGKPINHLRLQSGFEDSILKRLRRDVVKVTPLNLVDYRLDRAIAELKAFSGYEYYGAKHHESILTRFLQCAYLPEKFGADKRRSHLSSLVISGQMTREEAVEQLKKPAYPSQELREFDCNALAEFLKISREDFDALVALPPKSHDDYPKSWISNRLIPFVVRNRKMFHI